MVVEAYSRSHAEVGTDLKFVLHISAGLFRAVIAVGITLQEGRGDEPVRGVGDGQALEEVGEIAEPDHSAVRPLSRAR